MSDELPQGWASARLEEIVTKKKGKKPAVLRDTPAEGFIPYLDIRAIEKNVIREYAEVKSSKIASKDDLFVVWDGARSGWVGGGITGAIGSTIMALTVQTVESAYVRRFIAGQFQNLNTNTRGTGIPHVDPEVFWNLEVPLAPLAEQRRIVAKLEKLLGQVDACQQRLVKLPTVLKRFRQSILAAACSGRLTADWREDVGVTGELPPNWSAKNLGEVATFSQGIQIGLEQHLTEPKPGYVRFLRIVNYTQNGGEFRFVPDPGPRYHVSPDEVVMVRYGEAGFVGRGFEGVLANNLFKIIPGQSLSRDYLYHLLKSPSVSQEIIQKRKGGSMPAISFDIVSELPVWIPPLAEQQEIVRRVAGLFALANQLEQRLAQARGQVAKLTPSLLARAFAGQLVPQNPEDEPAGKLLERIRPGGKP
jgi:type I restriction enzyme S subunit